MKKIADKFLTGFEKLIEGHIFHDKNIVWFRRCVYLLLLLKLLFIWPALPLFYRHVVSQGIISFWPQKWMFLPLFQNYYQWYWLAACITVFFAVVSRGRWLLSLAVFIVSLNYLILANMATNNGDKLLNAFILALIFVNEGAKKNSARQMMNNAVLLILQVHFSLLYFLNAYGKIIQPFWRNGSSMGDVWKMPYYANADFIPSWFLNPVANLLISWSVILFELLFSILIWYKPLKKPLLITGVLFHIGIALFLSLPDFGLTMIIAYILFFDFKKRAHTPEGLPVRGPF